MYHVADFTLDPINPNQWMHKDGMLVALKEGQTLQSMLDEVLNAPEPEVDPKDELRAYAGNARWKKEIGGVDYAGMRLATDDRSKMLIMGARMAASFDPNWSTIWQGADGSSHEVDRAGIEGISNAVQEHVNTCFIIYSVVKTAIDDGSITTTAEIDAAFA